MAINLPLLNITMVFFFIIMTIFFVIFFSKYRWIYDTDLRDDDDDDYDDDDCFYFSKYSRIDPQHSSPASQSIVKLSNVVSSLTIMIMMTMMMMIMIDNN